MRHPTNVQIIVNKADRRLRLERGGEILIECAFVMGFSPVGDKAAKGDGRTPEGEFNVVARNPESRYHLGLCLNYPRREDAARGLDEGIISREEYDRIVDANADLPLPPQDTALGGEIYIHGGG